MMENLWLEKVEYMFFLLGWEVYIVSLGLCIVNSSMILFLKYVVSKMRSGVGFCRYVIVKLKIFFWDDLRGYVIFMRKILDNMC